MRKLLAALYDQAPRGVHGYDLMRMTGLKAGTLYPLLISMTDRDLVYPQWHEPADPGRPARHAYRLTSEGLELARVARQYRSIFDRMTASA